MPFVLKARRAVAFILTQVIVLQPLGLYSRASWAQACPPSLQDGREGTSTSNPVPVEPGESADDDSGSSACPLGACGNVPETANERLDPAIEPPGNEGEWSDGDYGSGDGALGNPGGNDWGDGSDYGGTSPSIFGERDFSPGYSDSFGGGGGGSRNFQVVSDPIDTVTGNKHHVQVDYQSYGFNPLKLARVYNSLPSQDQAWKTANFGQGWRTNYDRSLYWSSYDPYVARLARPNGSIVWFRAAEWTSYRRTFVSDGGGVLTFTPNFSSLGNNLTSVGTWKYINNRNEIELYDQRQKIYQIKRNGQTKYIGYDEFGRLSSVSDGTGKFLSINYDDQNRVQQINVPGGSVLRYAYDANGSLVSVTYADGSVRRYLYEAPGNPRALTGIIDEAGQRYATWGYDAAGRATYAEFAGGTNRLWITYGTNQTTTVDHRGVQRIRTLQTFGDKVRVTSLSTNYGGSKPVPDWIFNYDYLGRLTSVIDRRGEVRTYVYDWYGRVVSDTRGAGTSAATTVQSEWHPQFRLRTQIVVNGVAVRRSFYDDGRLSTMDATGSDGLRVFRYLSYNEFGLVASVSEPNNRVTTIQHDSFTRNISSVTTPDGRTTNFLSYNAHGQPTQIQHPDGTLVTRTYDARGRLTSRAVGARVTGYQYDAAGLVTRITRPEGRFHAFTYDNARRLIRTTNERGERVDYARDDGGEITSVTVSDAQGNLVARRDYARDVLARPTVEFGAASQATQTVYDGVGDPATIWDPADQADVHQFDILGRRTAVSQYPLPWTWRSFNANGRVATITNPKNVTATYGYDSLNRMTSETRSEFGTRSRQLRDDGLPARIQLANGVTLNFGWDTAQRLTSVTAADGAAVALSYVANTSVPLVSTMTDPSGSTSWTYDTGGRVLTKQQTAGGIAQTLSITRDAIGRPTQITYPSGATVALTWTNGLPSGLAVNGAVLANPIRHVPMGTAPAGWTWGNGFAQERSFDADGRPTAVTIGNARQTNQFDALGRVTRQTDIVPGNSTFPERLISYDRAGRLSAFVDSTGRAQSFTYDASGDLTAYADSNGTLNFTYDPARPHRLLTAGARSFTYDAAGNTTSDGIRTFAYNGFGRLSRVTIGSTTVDSTYNGQGLRVRKTVTTNGVTTTTLFFYDEAGRLLGEYAGNGALIQETVWFGGLPVATIRPDGVYYVQADHLGTPRAVLRPGDNAVVWRWDSDPFGSTPAQEATVNGQPFKYHLRFPGQYLDVETGLHYNVFRDYDPSTGRYVQADPTGLRGGINTYAYVKGNPVSIADPLGLWTLEGTVCAGVCVGGLIGEDPGTGQGFGAFVFGYGWGGGLVYNSNGGIPAGSNPNRLGDMPVNISAGAALVLPGFSVDLFQVNGGIRTSDYGLYGGVSGPDAKLGTSWGIQLEGSGKVEFWMIGQAPAIGSCRPGP